MQDDHAGYIKLHLACRFAT